MPVKKKKFIDKFFKGMVFTIPKNKSQEKSWDLFIILLAYLLLGLQANPSSEQPYQARR